MSDKNFPAAGRCTCGEIEYILNRHPMFVHCCHCSWCQRETGSAFALNALIESEYLSISKGVVEKVETASNSGLGQVVLRCPNCEVALWSHYGAAKETVAFVRAGTLDNPNLCPPDIHIYTASKQRWVELGDTVAKVEAFYRKVDFWPEESIKRYKHAIAG